MAPRGDWRSVIGDGEPVIVAVSGGADSVCLLHHLRSEVPATPLIVVHVNHRTRGAESDADEEFVRLLAEKLGLPFHAQRIDPALVRARANESLLRTLRLGLLKALARGLGVRVIAFGQHRDDLAESFLLAALRGSGPRGLAAMEEVREVDGAFHFIRPLLDLSRIEIEERLRALGQDWRDDSSNADESYRRNFVRHRVLPLLREIDPAAVESIATSAALCAEMDAVYSHEVGKALTCVLGRTRGAVLFSPAAMRESLDESLFPGVLRRLVADIFPGAIPARAVLRDATRRLATEDAEEAGFRLHEEVSLWVGNHYAIVYTGLDIADALLALSASFPFRIDAARLIAEEPPPGAQPTPDRGEQACWLDAGALSGAATIRKAGDDERIPLKDGHTKAVADCLREAGVPTLLRPRVLVVADDAGILWIPGVRRSGRAWITNETRQILKLTVAGNTNA
jgi:tRNA(Ile)-lysidine synthase